MSKQYVFWFNMKKYTVDTPTMVVAEIIKLGNASPYDFYRERDGAPDVAFGHGERVDLTGEPRFYTVPRATMHRGLPE